MKQYTVNSCDMCAGEVRESEAVYAVLYDEDVRVCGTECFHRLRRAWGRKRVNLGSYLMISVALVMSFAALTTSLMFVMTR